MTLQHWQTYKSFINKIIIALLYLPLCNQRSKTKFSHKKPPAHKDIMIQIRTEFKFFDLNLDKEK